ncbi:disease resistance protein RPM1-like [Pyrus ussuriensis x Pyrus communis]|uniref:Disease resistance protein RPM1-like n=1 Tax=Pyrus ussuriensis x Pyrus communis TaxID=2448454 RepID=A0A5N5HZ40_9ROSA|nr:disease resistance protein RPM1-like [Pyrus ussuriensis x Pyrus communis]
MESAASLLIGKIVGILENEVSSIAAVRDEVDELKLEIISMKSFLIDAEGKEPQIEGVKTWVTSNKAESSLYIMEDELIGIENKKQTLMGLLMNGEKHEMVVFVVGMGGSGKTTFVASTFNNKNVVVSVVGMGGSGKTTLVASTFNNENVKRHFDCYAWFTEEVPEYLNFMSYEDLLEMLSTYLKSKRYLVVLDNVWDIKLWQEIRIPLLNRHHGSRIMLTTREKDIAFYFLKLKLFSKKAFSTYDNKSCPPKLESLAWKLVEKCEGLPLALVTLGGLMSSKKSSSE